MTLAIQLTNWQ